MTMTNDSREAVVFIHGFWGSPATQVPMFMRFRHEGYKTYLFGYSSVKKSPAQNAKDFARLIDRIEAKTIHIVAHSLALGVS